MKQCTHGHIYDETIHSSCPYCSESGKLGARPLGGAPDFPKTAALVSPSGTPSPDFPKTAPLNVPSGAGSPNFPKTEALVKPAQPKNDEPSANVKKEMGVTVALNVTDSGINPLRGWLVAVTGEKSGLSFNIHSEKNFIGRGRNFDIDLSFDKAVSKEGDAVISYDARNRKFYLTIHSGKNNVYHNDSILLSPVEIKDYDTIEIGSTKFVFRSFCNENFTY